MPKFPIDWDYELKNPFVSIHTMLKNPEDFVKLEIENNKIGLINNSGKSLYTKVENTNFRKQLFFNLEAGKLSYVVRYHDDAYLTFSAESPFDQTSKIYLVSNESNY